MDQSQGEGPRYPTLLDAMRATYPTIELSLDPQSLAGRMHMAAHGIPYERQALEAPQEERLN